MVKVLTLCYITILVLKFGDLGFEKVNIHTQGTLKIKISGGDLNKFSNPGVCARNSARNLKLKSGVAEGWSSNYAHSSRPIRAKYLGRQLHNKPEKRLSSRQTPYPVDSAHPQCGALSSKRNTETDRLMTTHNGLEIALNDQSSSHLTSGHGHDFRVYDSLPIDVRQKISVHKKVQTRINRVNKNRFGDAVENIVRDPTTRVFQDIFIRGVTGQGYVNKNSNGTLTFVGVHTEGKFAGQIKKAQPMNAKKFSVLVKNYKID